MKTVAPQSLSLVSRQRLENIVTWASRIGGIVIFALAITAVAYFLLAN